MNKQLHKLVRHVNQNRSEFFACRDNGNYDWYSISKEEYEENMIPFKTTYVELRYTDRKVINGYIVA